MPYLFAKLSLSDRRRSKVLSLRPSIKAMRPCKNYSRRGQPCRVSEGSNKYINYIRLGEPCNLAPLNVNKQKRLEKERKRLRLELREVRAKARRIEKLVKSVKNKQEDIISNKQRNITELEDSKQLSPLIDVVSKQVALLTSNSSWSLTSLSPFDKTPIGGSYSLLGS